MVFVGRATLYGVAAGGEEGAKHALDILRTEVDRVFALLGCPSVGELGPDYLLRPDFAPVPARAPEQEAEPGRLRAF